MPYGEREAATGLITMLIVMALFWVYMSGQHAAGAFAGPDALQAWARSVLILVAISIPIAIVVTILAAITQGILTGKDKVDDHRDERDVQIERRAMQISTYILSFGILGVIVDLALGASALRAMNLILALSALSELFKDSFKLFCYRRGF
jgi:heme/copper-type cytochrome/quinol oxidase subunit 2